MTDDVGAAAPADSAPVAEAVIEPAVQTPNPISTEPAPSIDDALDRAEAKVKAESAKDAPAPVKSEAKAEPVKTEPVKSEAKRDDTGKFASDKPAVEFEKVASESAAKVASDTPKPATPASDAPARFAETAKAKWAATDPEIRGETERAIRELTEGHAKYKASAEKFESVKEFDEMATKSGTDLKTALTRYVNMEQMLRSPNPIKGLEALCDNLGISLKDVAAHVMGQTPDQQSSQSDATIRELKATVADLQKQVGGVTQTFQQQRETATHQEVTKFAEANPRFDELADDIAFFLKTRTTDLSEAYKLAERLNPAPAQVTASTPASSAESIDLVAQTQKGSKSINGAPSHGSSPATRKSSKSLDESLDKAFAAFG
jgi:hypothetical protein